MSDWANWNTGLKGYGEFTDSFLKHADGNREMDSTKFGEFMKTLGVKDGDISAVPDKDKNGKVSLSEIIARLDTVDKRDKNDSDGKFNREELDAVFKPDATSGSGSGSGAFGKINTDKSGANSLLVSKDEMKAYFNSFDKDGNGLDGYELQAMAKDSKGSADKLAEYANAGGNFDGYLSWDEMSKAFTEIDAKDGGANDGQITAAGLGSLYGTGSSDGGTSTDGASSSGSGSTSGGSGGSASGTGSGNGTSTGGGNATGGTSSNGSSGGATTGGTTGAGGSSGGGSSSGGSSTGGTNSGASSGTGDTSSTATLTQTLAPSDTNGDLLLSTGEIFDALIASNTHGGDYAWTGDSEMEGLAKALKVDVAEVKSAAGTDGVFDIDDLGKLVATADGQGTDNALNGDQSNNLFKTSAA
ncbi:MAG TPA: hypothetical protein VEA41_23405 [Salinarimonas sp.]|nr:hypothetical protein [Salinarimonas sp.]